MQQWVVCLEAHADSDATPLEVNNSFPISICRAATIHFLKIRYISRYKCHDTIHNMIHHYIQLTSDVILLNCFEIIYFHCVVPENIHTPITKGSLLRTPPPPRIFHFFKKMVTSLPSGFSTNMIKTPIPSGKFTFLGTKC